MTKLLKSEHGPFGATGYGATLECMNAGVQGLLAHLQGLHGGGGATEQMALGSALHLALAHYYLRIKDGSDAWLPPKEAVRAAWEQGDLQGYDPEGWGGERVAALLPHLCPRKAPYWTVVAVEEIAPVDLGDGEVYAPRVDLIYETRNGVRHFLDWKSTSSHAKDDTFVADYELRLQFRGMHLLADQHKGPSQVEVGRINVYRDAPPVILPTKRREPFVRGLKAQLGDVATTRRVYAQDILNGARSLDDVPRNGGPHCYRCAYWRRCRGSTED